LAGGEKVGGIGRARVAPKGVSRTVNRIGARFYPHIYDRAGPPAILRLGILLGVEFLDGVYRHQGLRVTDVILSVEPQSTAGVGEGGKALDHQEVSTETRAIGARRGAGANAPAHHDINSGAQIHQM